MKKIKNLLTILLTLILIFSACLLLTGCNIEPYRFDTWYLESYSDENGEKYYVDYDTIKQEILYSDDITIRYFEDGTFKAALRFIARHDIPTSPLYATLDVEVLCLESLENGHPFSASLFAE